MVTQIDPRIQEYVSTAVAQSASDVHFMTNGQVVVRRDGKLFTLSESNMTAQDMTEILQSILPEGRYEKYIKEKELDFSLTIGTARLRGNAYFEKGFPALSLRIVPSETPSLDSLGLPEVAKNLLQISQGFVIIAGPTGHGKSTTLAAMVESINQSRSEHIITLEDPIEYMFTPKRSIISQREVGRDTLSFAAGLRAALREDPNVILVGEMRDLETIEAALTLAETGHLVLATLHTNSAAQTADRIIDVFPASRQGQIRVQLAEVLQGIISQRLLPQIKGGRVLATEVLIATTAVRNLIREGKIHQIPNVIQTSAAEGMISLDKELARFVSEGVITVEEATAWSLDPKAFKLQLYQ